MIATATYRVPPGYRFRRHEHAGVHISIVLERGFVERTGKA